jgi:hypothetical protein
MWVHYIPIATTIVAALFAISLFQRYRVQPSTRLLWWAIGITCYCLGALLESCITLFGNTIWLTKAWYVAGAILGGYPLAQGSLYLFYSRRFAHRATAISLPIVVITSILVFLSPALRANLELTRPSGAILGWKWVRLMTPFINTYAMFFLIGVAAISSWRYSRSREWRNRAVGNAMIAVGALMPAIGGSMAKAGVVEALYVLEFIGLILIWCGARICAAGPLPEDVLVKGPAAVSQMQSQ